MTATSLPVCDIAALRTGSARQQARTVLDIGASARRTGLFTIVNHGIPDIVTEQAFAAARRFFALSPHEKERVATGAGHAYRGYASTPAGEGSESFKIGRDIAPDDPAAAGGTPVAGFNRWPELPGFREPTMAFFKAVDSVAMQLQRAFALDLGMPPDFFSRFCDRPLTTLRLLHHPVRAPLPDAPVHDDGAPQHDWGIFTLLAHAGGGGFDVQTRDGEWTRVDAVPNSFVCSIGDCLMRWSNDRYAARPHRVVNRTDRAGYSTAFSADPNADALIACLPTCQDEDEAAKYAPISYAEYRQQRYAADAAPAAL
jgi:isopenicillin N synthase-like dioxygenase